MPAKWSLCSCATDTPCIDLCAIHTLNGDLMRPIDESVDEYGDSMPRRNSERLRLIRFREDRRTDLVLRCNDALKGWLSEASWEYADDVLARLEGYADIRLGPRLLLSLVGKLGLTWHKQAGEYFLRADREGYRPRFAGTVIRGLSIDAEAYPHGSALCGRLYQYACGLMQPVTVSEVIADIDDARQPFRDMDEHFDVRARMLATEARRVGLQLRRYGRGMMLLPKTAA